MPLPVPVNRVILCAYGDSSDINLWSNIPFFLGAEFEKRNIEVIRINLKVPRLFRRLWRYSIGILHKLLHWQTSFDFYRSRTNHCFATRRLNQAIRKYGAPGTILINLSISFAPTLKTIPVVLLSDWDYQYFITERLGRTPDLSEQATIHRDRAAMARANLVVLLFPESAARLQRYIPNGRFRFLGHVINDHPLAPPPPGEPPALKPHSPWRLLFVGRPRYSEGLALLLQALTQLPADLSVQLDAIGISSHELSSSLRPNRLVRMHGYLSKANAVQRHTYYTLLNQADLVINASSRWGGVSATVEAMHRCTAVLTPPYAEFQALFGRTIPFGAYLSELTPAAVGAAICAQLQEPDRLAIQQQAAFEAVKGFTWESFVDRLLTEVDLPPTKDIPQQCTAYGHS